MNSASEALVRISYGAHGVVEDSSGLMHACLFRRAVGRPCCGDRVMVRRVDSRTLVVEEILVRKNEFMRADQRGRPQVIAANLDQVMVVIAPRPLPSRDGLDRYLVAIHSMGITPVIVMNKTDLPVAGSDPGSDTLRRLDDYSALGYPVIRVSAHDPEAVKILTPAMGTGTSILVGQSGVGKSSLVRALLPDLDIQTGALSRVTGKGTHTTTTTILYELPGGGRLIDSPGVWEYGLWKIEDTLIADGFPEFGPFRGQCRFHNCVHLSEPGCAIKQAVGDQQLCNWRYSAYTRLLQQNRKA